MEHELLKRLFSGGETSQAAWKDFLEGYSNLFLKIIWEMEKDREAVMDTYLRVCLKFAERDFAILRKFKRRHGDNPPKFTTWLGAVVRNMCVDAYRSVKGRDRLPKALLRFPEQDKKIFELYYWRGLSYEEIERRLETSRNGSGESIREILERLETLLLRPPLSPYTKPMTVRVPFDDENVVIATAAQPAMIPQETMDRWLSYLPTDERLLIQLKFWDDLSMREIGRVLKISSAERLRVLLADALKNLRKIAERERLV
ncbi:MAG: sigma factor-like helix-turn-helix DNA-binding protein [Bacteroidota bacterium]